MYLAANMLGNSNVPLARIAEEVGYQTDTAFSRAFRREYGAPPAAWRRSLSKSSAKKAAMPMPNLNPGYAHSGGDLAYF